MKEIIYIQQLIRYYELYQEEAKTNIENIFQSFKKHNPNFAEVWKNILSYWHSINTTFPVEIIKSVADIPDYFENYGNGEHLAISILGIKLNDDGSMNDELISRLEVGLLLSQYFEKAYIVVTGGPTANQNKSVTEGGEMKKWLVGQGVSEDRIIVEDKALDTVGNAIYTYQILEKQYPHITSIILVSSDYHVARGSLLYYSTLALEASKSGGNQLEIIANVGCKTNNPGYETIYLQAWSLCQVANIDYWRLNIILE